MAQITVVELIDDLDGSEATQSLTFALDGVDFEIDLNDANAEDLRSTLARYSEKARRAGGRKRSLSEVRAAGPSSKDIRAWAQAQGLEVNSRGRINGAVMDQYMAAN
ncbi:Lsr2 family protein [Arthrobacter sp. UYCo732]|uniref:histone-like nucleoid-structuring protein Lsr2 n=1 Tax=Arthrobacter sp. UYCo732 TaxID=3156336 RepID=UPI00339AD5DE